MPKVTFFLCLLSLAACAAGDKSGGDSAPSVGIGVEGGTVVSDDGLLSLEVPAGALSEVTRIEISSVGTADAPAYDMRPDGLEFAIPAVATLSADPSLVEGPDGMLSAVAATLTPASGGPEIADGVRITRTSDDRLTVTVDVPHFSTVGFSSDDTLILHSEFGFSLNRGIVESPFLVPVGTSVDPGWHITTELGSGSVDLRVDSARSLGLPSSILLAEPDTRGVSAGKGWGTDGNEITLALFATGTNGRKIYSASPGFLYRCVSGGRADLSLETTINYTRRADGEDPVQRTVTFDYSIPVLCSEEVTNAFPTGTTFSRDAYGLYAMGPYGFEVLSNDVDGNVALGLKLKDLATATDATGSTVTVVLAEPVLPPEDGRGEPTVPPVGVWIVLADGTPSVLGDHTNPVDVSGGCPPSADDDCTSSIVRVVDDDGVKSYDFSTDPVTVVFSPKGDVAVEALEPLSPTRSLVVVPPEGLVLEFDDEPLQPVAQLEFPGPVRPEACRGPCVTVGDSVLSAHDGYLLYFQRDDISDAIDNYVGPDGEFPAVAPTGVVDPSAEVAYAVDLGDRQFDCGDDAAPCIIDLLGVGDQLSMVFELEAEHFRMKAAVGTGPGPELLVESLFLDNQTLAEGPFLKVDDSTVALLETTVAQLLELDDDVTWDEVERPVYPCEDDDYEPNDSQEAAALLTDSSSPSVGQRTRTHTVSEGDDDWFKHLDMVNFSTISGPYDWVITVDILGGDPGATLRLERIDASGTVLAPIVVSDGQTIVLSEAMPQGRFQGDFVAHWSAVGGCVEVTSTYEFVE